MSRIRQLSPTLINQIAAGEVVDRPASVVKELLENAVDAGSRRIDVEVTQGGLDLIRVADDGCGIPAADLPLAFASHATSKLSSAEDLFRIGTLGFRGEALASVGSIAQVTLQSRPAGQECGAAITCRGGELGTVIPWNGAPGTRVEVRHLFYNVPARRKFLKGAGIEMGHVSEVFTRLALSQLGIHWTLRHNGRPVYEAPGSMGLLDRIGLFFGADVRNSLYMLEAEEGLCTLGGYVGDPSCERSNSQVLYLFLNGRWVRDRGLSQAVQDAYRGLLMHGRYPVAFLMLEVPPDEVDVNVHPTKAEVRFHDKDGLYRLVHKVVRARLQAADLTARLQLNPGKQFPSAAEVNDRASLPADKSAPPLPPGKERAPSPKAAEMPAAARSVKPPPLPRNPVTAASGGAPPSVTAAEFFPAAATEKPPAAMGRPQVRDAEPLPTRKADVARAMQVLDCYLVVEVPPDEVLFIDQHALHERILFEQLQERVRAGSVETQRLLIPEPVNLPASVAPLVLEQRAALAELGLAVEDFGGGTILLTGYPAILGQRSPSAVFRAVATYLAAQERLPAREQFFNDLLSLMACHAAVRAGDRLSADQIQALLEQRALAQDSHHCPHGRPTSLLFSRYDLDRRFKRV